MSERKQADNASPDGRLSRRQVLGGALRGGAVVVLGGTAAAMVVGGGREELVWQIDPEKCTKCTRCATHCVLETSAVKAVQSHGICGYCEICFGFFSPKALATGDSGTGAENQLCPTGAIDRKFIEEPYFQYNVIEEKCIGCAKCIEGCNDFGNGSLYLQVRHDRCLNCNECAIAVACPADAFIRVPASRPYLLRDNEMDGGGD